MSDTLAFEPHVWAYDTGRPDRQKELLIRFRIDEDKPANARRADMTWELHENDETNAGKEWSPEELDITTAESHEVAVVVGELLPLDQVPTHATLAVPNISKGQKFDPEVHTVVPTCERTGIVVRKVSSARTNLYVLYNKERGLCNISQLPSGKEVKSRLVFYDEWVRLDENQHPKVLNRKNQWRNNITRFCQRLLQSQPANTVDGHDAQNFLKRARGVKRTIEEFMKDFPAEQPTGAEDDAQHTSGINQGEKARITSTIWDDIINKAGG